MVPACKENEGMSEFGSVNLIGRCVRPRARDYVCMCIQGERERERESSKAASLH